MSTELVRTSIHESGHGVVIVHLGGEVRVMTAAHGGGLTRFNLAGLHARLCACVAGALAEGLHLKQAANWTRYLSTTDRQLIASDLAADGQESPRDVLDAPAVVDAALETVGILRGRWPAVLQLAETLRRDGIASDSTVRRAMGFDVDVRDEKPSDAPRTVENLTAFYNLRVSA